MLKKSPGLKTSLSRKILNTKSLRHFLLRQNKSWVQLDQKQLLTPEEFLACLRQTFLFYWFIWGVSSTWNKDEPQKNEIKALESLYYKSTTMPQKAFKNPIEGLKTAFFFAENTFIRQLVLKFYLFQSR